MDSRRAADGIRDPAAVRRQTSGVTEPVRCGTVLQAANENPPPAGAIRTFTVEGSSTGLANATDQSKESPRAAPTEASARDAVYIPWAIARGKPNALAASADRWIGLWSPDTDAYRR